MFFTRLKSTASCLKSGDSVNSGSVSSLRRATSGAISGCRTVRDRPDVSGVVAALLEHESHAIGQERPERVVDRRRRWRRSRPRGVDQAAERQAQVQSGQLGQVDQNPHDALSGATQPVRIARSGRPLAGGEHPENRIELVGERHGGPRDGRAAELFLGRWRRRLDGHRQVVKVDGLPHFFGPALFARVDSAHRPLQLGELANHVGGQIGLAEPAGVGRVLGEVRAAQTLPNRSAGPAFRLAPPCPDRCRASCGTAPSRDAERAAPAAAHDRRRGRTAHHATAPSARARDSWRSRPASPAPCSGPPETPASTCPADR